MSDLRLAIVIGSTRPGRLADVPANWLQEVGATLPRVVVDLLDLRSFELPFFNEEAPPAAKPPVNPAATAWSHALARYDGFVLLTPEYNHAPPAVLKNALDYAFVEYARKPVAFAGYGALGAARAIQCLRLQTTALGMASLPKAVHIAGGDFMSLRADAAFAKHPHLLQAVNLMYSDLVWWASALKTARAQ